MELTAASLEEKATRPFQVKNVDAEGSFEGHGAMFNDLHPTSSWALSMDWKDRIMPGAFKKTLNDHARAGTQPAMLYMHQRGNLVGAWRELGEVGAGLHTKGNVALSARTPAGTALHELMKMGGLNALSIGMRVTKHLLDEAKKIREILEVELFEVSLVDIPGIHRARVTDVKASDPRFIEYVERVLRDAGLSRREAKALLAEGFDALRDAEANDDRDLRDAGSDGGTTEVLADIRRLVSTIRP